MKNQLRFTSFLMNNRCTIYPHPLKYGAFVLIVENSPLHFIGTKAECEQMREKWKTKIKDYGKKRTPTNVYPGTGCEDLQGNRER